MTVFGRFLLIGLRLKGPLAVSSTFGRGLRPSSDVVGYPHRVTRVLRKMKTRGLIGLSPGPSTSRRRHAAAELEVLR